MMAPIRVRFTASERQWRIGAELVPRESVCFSINGYWAQ